MVVWATRVAFILVIFGVGWAAIADESQPLGGYTWLLLAISLVVGVFVIIADFLAPRKKLSIFAGTFFGLLVGLVLAYALSFVTQPLIAQVAAMNPELFDRPGQVTSFTQYVNLLVGAITCYLSISFVLQTKDDFRFIVPYTEFSKQTKGNRPLVLDTSVLIDGRIADLVAVGLFDAPLIVPRFVLNELQQVADSADKLKRNRGRRGLDVLARMQKTPKLELIIQEASHLDPKETRVDQLVMILAKELSGRVMTTDFNLNKVAQVGGVDVVNVNDLANALKPEVLPGESMRVRIVKPGEESQQGVGFMDDGTMVVVEHGKPFVGQDVDFVVTNTRQTSAGKMIFGRLQEDAESASSPKDDDSAKPPAAPEARGDGRGESRNDPRRGFGRSPRRGNDQRG